MVDTKALLLFSIGESLLTSLFTFSSLAYGLTHRSRGNIYELNAKVERADYIKIGRRNFLKVYCSGRAASRKNPGSTGLLSIFPGKCRTFRKCIE